MELLDDFLLHGHLLENCKTETLGDTTISAIDISADNLYDFLEDSKVIGRLMLTPKVDQQVIHSLQSAWNDRDKGTHGMFQSRTVHLEQIYKEFTVLILMNQKDIVAYELRN